MVASNEQPDPDILLVPEVMRYLRITDRDTLYALVRKKKLAAFRVGRQYRFRRDVVLAFSLGGKIEDQKLMEERTDRAVKPDYMIGVKRTIRR